MDQIHDVNETAIERLERGDWVLTGIAVGRGAHDLARRLDDMTRNELGLDGQLEDAVILVGHRRRKS